MKLEVKKQNPAILIMAKVPRAGLVKTRLKPFLSDSQCADLAACFLLDTVHKAKQITGNIIVAYAPSDGKDEIKKLLNQDVRLIEQIGNSLGEKMQAAIEFVEKKDFSPIVVIGTDSPNFPTDYLRESINLIENRKGEIVLGATADGGYYLIGFKKSVKNIFANIEWSSEKTFAQNVANAKSLTGKEPLQIPAWYDVDTPSELKILFREYSESSEFSSIAPNTARWLAANENFLAENLIFD